MKLVCQHCTITLPDEECGHGTVLACWCDSNGDSQGDYILVCQECLWAGEPGGPGYAAWPKEVDHES